MIFSSLYNIVRGFEMNKGQTIHWLLQDLKYGVDCLRELALDDLQIVNSRVVKLNSYQACAIPEDCISNGIISVGIKRGQWVKPLTKTEGLNRNYNYDSHGNPRPYPTESPRSADLSYLGVPYLTYYMNQYNTRGENTGGMYGYRTDGSPFIYEIMEERQEIQFDPGLCFDEVVIVYVSDGRTVSAASMIPTAAERTIETYIDWQRSEHNRSVSLGEKQYKSDQYVGARTVLRGRLNDMDTHEIITIFRNNYHGAPKT